MNQNVMDFILREYRGWPMWRRDWDHLAHTLTSVIRQCENIAYENAAQTAELMHAADDIPAAIRALKANRPRSSYDCMS